MICCLVLPRWLVLVTLLGVGVLGGVLFLSLRGSQGPTPPRPPETVEVAWAFEAQKRGAIISSPLVAGDRVYVAALHDTAFTNAGALYCLDRATGKPLWTFDDSGKLQHMYSSPCLAEGRLYLGEGMHANFTCKLYCLDAATGRKLWHFVAAGHIESTPCVADGKVFFGAGDDGLYCLDAASGEKRWQFQGPWHIDSSPAVAGGRVYAGSGVSRKHRRTEAVCLDTDEGKVVWRLPTDLPVWGSPVVAGDEVFFGLGNGRLTTSAELPEKPAGALLCVACQDGECRWRRDVSDAVLEKAAVGPRHVYFGARDGQCWCLDRRTGEVCWKQDLGSPVVTCPALLEERLYVVASAGRVCCLDPASGHKRWTFDVARATQTSPQLFSSPTVVAEGERRRLYFGTELRTPDSNAAVLYCLRD